MRHDTAGSALGLDNTHGAGVRAQTYAALSGRRHLVDDAGKGLRVDDFDVGGGDGICALNPIRGYGAGLGCLIKGCA